MGGRSCGTVGENGQGAISEESLLSAKMALVWEAATVVLSTTTGMGAISEESLLSAKMALVWEAETAVLSTKTGRGQFRMDHF